MAGKKYNQGYFKPINPKKYNGNPTNIVYRSGWELRLMSHFDTHQSVIWWQSEEKPILYKSPIDGRTHRYFPDFIVHVINREGKPETVMIEVKPHAQTKEPEVKKKPTQRYIREVFTYGVNKAKWDAAQEYCKDRGWKFEIMTEQQIFGKK